MRPAGRPAATPTSWPPGRPPAEDAAIATCCGWPARPGARVHVVHLSAASALPQLARGPGGRACAVSVETCPHYLALTAEEVPDGDTRVQVLPADARGGQPGRAVAGPRRRRDRHGGLATTHPARPSSSTWTPATSAPRGAASRRCSSGCPSCGPRPARRGHGLADVVGLDGRTRPPRAGRARPQGPHRRGRRRRPRRVRARRALHGGTSCTTATRSPRTRGRNFTEWCGRPGCAARRSTERRAGGCCDEERTGERACERTNVAAPTRSVGRASARPCVERLPGTAGPGAALGRRRCRARQRRAFAAKENLITPGRPAFDPTTFGSQGQGLRRLGDPPAPRTRPDDNAYDEAIVRLGAPGVVHGVVVDTAWFTGNYPPEVSVDGVCVDG